MSTHTLGWVAAISTIVSMLAVIGACAWSLSGRRRPDFEAAARLPLEEDAPARGEMPP
jgi:cytochrome c oxidase cbb3-type subunit IV